VGKFIGFGCYLQQGGKILQDSDATKFLVLEWVEAKGLSSLVHITRVLSNGHKNAKSYIEVDSKWLLEGTKDSSR
jgi:hypothetical protein